MCPPRLTLVQYSGHFDGSALSALSIAKGFRQNGWHTHLIFGTKGKVYQDCIKNGFPVQYLPHKSWLRDTRSLGFLKRMMVELKLSSQFNEAYRVNRSQLIYINTVVSLAASAAAKKINLPSVWHIREMMQDQGGELKAPPLLLPFIPYLFKYFSKHFIFNTVTAHDAMFGNKLGGHIIPVGISPLFEKNNQPSATCRRKLNLPLNAKLIGIPGGLRWVKGQDWFLNAIKDWLHQHPSIHISLAGSGEKTVTDTLTNLVDNSNLGDRVHFLGDIQEMPEFYRANDVICIPSRSESFGRCAVEAMASRVPVLASTSGGLKEVILDGRNGLTIQFGDDLQLIEALKKLLWDESLTNKLTKMAFEDYKNKYTESRYQDQIVTFCRGVMSN